jgi:hypothetical protein
VLAPSRYENVMVSFETMTSTRPSRPRYQDFAEL